jgi:hypothetical protein
MADDINKINDEINKLRKQLKQDPLKPFNEKDLEVAKALLSGLRAEVRDLSSDLDYIKDSFKDSVNELSKQNTYLISAKKQLQGISDISRKVLEYRRGDISLSEKQLKNLQQQAKSKFDILKNDIQRGKLDKTHAKEIKEALKSEEQFNAVLKKTIKYQKEVNQEIGLLGTGLKGAASLLSKAGFGDLSRPLNDAVEKTKNARLQTKLNKEQIKEINELQGLQNKKVKDLTKDEKERRNELIAIYGTNKKDLEATKNSLESQNKELSIQQNKYKNIGESLKEQLTYANFLDFVLVQVGKAILSVDKQTGDLAKGFNISYKEAKNIRKELFQMAVDSGDLTANTRAYQETILSIGKALGSNAILNKKDLQTFTDLREKAGLTNEELNEQQKLAYVSGQYLKDNVGSMLSAAKVTGLNNKILLNEKDIMRDVGNTSNAIKLSLGGGGKALGEAAAQAKVLGMNMQQVENIAGSLLNFESSISAELEAELLTGKDLNLEMARLYAINNDMAGVAREIRKNYGSIEEFGRMNRLQQDAAAKAVGMTREELARTLTDERALAGLSGEKRNAAQAALEFARAKGMTEEQIRKEEISNLENQMSIQERLNASVEKLKESFVIIAETLAPVFEGFANLVGWLAKSKTTMAVMVGLASAIAVSSAITAVANIFGGSARVLGPLAAITGGLITGIMFASMDSAESKAAKAKQSMGDGKFDNSTGNFEVHHKEGGIFVPSKNDQMAVGPDVVDRLKISKRSSTPDAYWGEQLANMSNQVSILTANVTKMIQTPPTFMIEGKVDKETLITLVSNNSGKISTQSSTNAWSPN